MVASWRHPLDVGRRVHGSGVGAAGATTETSLLEVAVFVVPFLLPIAAAIYLGIRLRAHAGTAPRSDEGSGQDGPWLEVTTLLRC